MTAAGFTSTGIAAGSIAAAIQSAIGNVAAGSTFATLQSLGAKSVIANLGIAGGAVFLLGYGLYKLLSGSSGSNENEEKTDEKKRKEEE